LKEKVFFYFGKLGLADPNDIINVTKKTIVFQG